MIRRALLAALALILCFLVVARLDNPDDYRQLPPCAVEDGSVGPVPCLWDASERGNHRGHDVIVTTPPRRTP